MNILEIGKVAVFCRVSDRTHGSETKELSMIPGLPKLAWKNTHQHTHNNSSP